MTTNRIRELHAALDAVNAECDRTPIDRPGISGLVFWGSILAIWFVVTGSGWPFFLVMGWVWGSYLARTEGSDA